MKKSLILIAVSMLAGVAYGTVPTGRFMQDHPNGYRDVRISADGKQAVWLTKDCLNCKEIKSHKVSVSDIDNGLLSIGGVEFEIISAKALFHPSMGDFGSGSFGNVAARH